MQHCDLVLIEGFKHGYFPKLEVWRASEGKPRLWPEMSGIVAVASDERPPGESSQAMGGPGLTRLLLADVGAIADFVLTNARPGLVDSAQSSDV